jgi:hypothetical protein
VKDNYKQHSNQRYESGKTSLIFLNRPVSSQTMYCVSIYF